MEVLKFGGSVLRAGADFARVADEIRQRSSESRGELVAVVSAMHGVTDRLYAEHARIAGASAAAKAEFIAQGEVDSCARLADALEARGLKAARIPLDGTGILTRGAPLDADFAAFDRARLLDALAGCDVAVVPGHVGTDLATGAPTLLGRSGSDLSALVLASELHAACRLYKDIDGVRVGGRRVDRMGWDELLALEALPIQAKAARFGRERGLMVEIGALGADRYTRIG